MTPTAWMIIPTYYPVVGGAQNQVRVLSQALIAANWSVRVLTRRHSYAHAQGLPAEAMLEGIPVARVYSRGRRGLGSLLYVLAGLSHLFRHRPGHIYHAHDIGAAAWLAIAARHLLGGRCLIKLRTGSGPYRLLLTSALARWQFLTLLRLADRVVVVNAEVEQLVRALGVPARRLVRLPNGVDTRHFQPVPPGQKPKLRAELGLAADKTVVLYVGRLEPLKGVDILLAAWARLPDAIRQKAVLVVVGDGPARAQLQQMSASLCVSASVHMLGERPGIRDYYWAADLFVLPSRTEGLSNALLEAMACELPVAAAAVGGAPDVIEHDRSGLLHKPEDEADLADKLLALIRSRSRWPAMGAHARQRVIEQADLTLVIDRYEGIYRELLTEAGAASR